MAPALKTIAVLLAIASVTSACTQSASRRPPPGGLSRSGLVYETQVSTGACADQPEALSLGATILGAVISHGVNRIGAAIEEAGKTQTLNALARRNLELRTGGLGKCIVVMRGWFHRSRPGANAAFIERDGSEFPYRGVNELTAFYDMGIYPAATPDFYFSGELLRNSDATSYTIIPREALLGRPIQSHIVRGDRRSVSIQFALVENGASAIKAGTGSTIVLGELIPDRLRTFSAAQCLFVSREDNRDVSRPGDCPVQATEQPGVTRIIRPTSESEWFGVTLAEKLKPMTLLANVSETRDPSAFLMHVAAIFKEVQKPLTTELQEALVPEIGADAAAAALTTEEAARNTYDKAYGTALTALQGCIDNPTDPGKLSAARVAVRELIGAARNAERRNYPVTEATIANIPAQGNGLTGCTTARTAVLAVPPT